jgi:RNA polymerase sigma factor (sigma-70 family)
MSLEDAEDAVHEAMLRGMENDHVEDERLGAWLTTVTMRLCVDRYRQINREAEVGSRSTLSPPASVPVDEVVCDRAEAKWLANRSGDLPARQAEALWLKSEDLDVGQVARKMGLSYRTAESLLARARRTMRKALVATLTAGLWLCWRGRPRVGSGAQAVTTASTAATLAALGLALPYVHQEEGERPPPPASERTDDWPQAAYDRDMASESPGLLPEPMGSHGLAGVGPAGPVGGVGLILPDVSLPVLPSVEETVSATPSVTPDLSVPDVPDVSVPDMPSIPQRTSGRLTAPVPGISSVPGTSAEGGVPDDLRDVPTKLRSTPLHTDVGP